MASENLPPDADRTLLIPAPGGRKPPQPATSEHESTIIASAPGGGGATPQAAASAPWPAGSGPIPALPAGGLNPLVSAAHVLLSLVMPLRQMASCPDIEALRQRVVEAVRAFETEAKAAGVDFEALAAARYALCTMMDETVTSTPWGGSGAWASRSLLVTFHNEAFGGEKFFVVLQRLAQDAARNIDALELFYLCLALGFEGRYRLIDGGRTQLDLLRERLHQLIRNQRGLVEQDLSPRWRAAQAQRKQLMSLLPLWVIGVAALLILGLLHLLFHFWLGRDTDPVMSNLAQIRIEAVRPAPVPVKPAVPVVRLGKFLQREIDEGLVTVQDTADRSIVSIRGDGMFASGSAELDSRFQPLMVRIGEALKVNPGKVSVVGHTDDRRAMSARFPSNWELSRARASAVATLLIEQAGPATRYTIEGRADSEPLAPNDTPANRARNRRVEIVLFVPVGGAR
ncbi:type VI secretion system protein ImpK [Chitinivorax tropicus]|uniref:Type VI secretion system protein ImpK n=1 Tax=Chitinivorax tropicus TaxID=714531 RepID=A0A840MP25_9PROT|nr:type IVB secretion system protein IcmH/DotU [Chitinivorax tropicus]MBB5018757.1 type VI secretion system protein ImpK [Chitinivorax tropicus]